METLREHNVYRKDTREVSVLFGFCYPSTYRAGMTGLATHLFYSLLNLREDTSCERYFRFDAGAPAQSIESGRPLRDNHIVGFSLTYEEDVLNLVQMLRLGGIAERRKDRRPDDPLVLIGGPVVSANPVPYSIVADALMIGEGDVAINEIVDSVRDSTSRTEALARMNGVEGLYLPNSGPTVVHRRIHPDLDGLFYPTAQVVPIVDPESHHEPVFGPAFLTEVTRGCGHSCKFCLIGHICRPRRSRSLGRLQELVEIGLQQTPVSKIALIGSSLGDMDRLDEFTTWIVDRELELSAPSLRADSISEVLLNNLVKGKQRTLTIAPETGSESLRNRMRKGLDDEDIMNAARLAESVGIRYLKLYFIIGLPGENDEDVESIASLIERITESTRLIVTASVNPYIPKANTALQRSPQPPLEEIRRRLRIVGSGLKSLTRVNLETLDPRSARIQAALSLGDKSTGQIIIAASRYGGYAGWRRAERETGIDFFSLANDNERLQGDLPWSFVRT
ncbi:radical SAM protein [Candidatus Thorarchaeota archaeon]|nr:MAG: radical SAM protein [Candidatus Thorarchaeota archaeon]